MFYITVFPRSVLVNEALTSHITVFDAFRGTEVIDPHACPSNETFAFTEAFIVKCVK